MKDSLSPILITLIILAIVFGVWFAGRQQGWFIRKTADDFNICLTGKDTVRIQYKALVYGITGWSARRENNENILHVNANISRCSQREITLIIDTADVRYIELYGKMYSIKDMQGCK